MSQSRIGRLVQMRILLQDQVQLGIGADTNTSQ